VTATLLRALDRASVVLGARCGLRFDGRNRDILERGLVRAAQHAACSVPDLIDRLESASDSALLQSVIRQVTIGETYFFRHPEDFAAVRELILPELLTLRRQGPLRVWSAGCATGEEAYSLAMTLESHIGSDRMRVLGSDLNQTALASARVGSYGRWSLRGNAGGRCPQLMPRIDQTVQVAPAVRARVRFEYLNLAEPVYPSPATGTDELDLIFCRNVLVYLLPEVARAALLRMRDCLVEGGYLVVSAMDLDFAPRELEVVHHDRLMVLKKPRPVVLAAAARPAPELPTPTVACTLAPVPPRSTSATLERLTAEAKAAADRGELERAVARLRHALTIARHPEVLHLLALVLSERGERAEVQKLLAEVVERAPDYVLGHLSYGLLADAGARRELHLRRVLALVAERRDDELLPGPEPLSVSWVRNLANVGLG
jgi:chemotaxis protein methyltransferase CheR